MPAKTQYTRSGDVHIAYQVVGDGPVDVVYVPGWVSHVELGWEEPNYARFLGSLASFSRLILFDKRGTGLSDRVPNENLPTLEERMDDVRVVMDAAGSEKAVIIGVSEGGNLSAYFAASHPGRVAGLILIGTYAKRVWSPDYPWAPTPEEREKEINTIEREWGELADLEHYAPSMISDAAFAERTATYLRRSASPGAAVALLRMNSQIDISNVLPVIQQPSLILHRTGDRDVNIAEARWIEERMSNAKLVELPGDDHFPWVGDVDALTGEIQQFVTGETQSQKTSRILASILFTDIVASTDLAQRVGDQSWKELLDRHDKMTLEAVAFFQGRLIDNTGDGMLATFDGPGRGIACAKEIMKKGDSLGLDIRAGLHTGECEIRDERVAGVAVHLAARVMGLAGIGEVLVSRTVRDLVAGSGFTFHEHGEHSLKGFDDKWLIYSVD